MKILIYIVYICVSFWYNHWVIFLSPKKFAQNEWFKKTSLFVQENEQAQLNLLDLKKNYNKRGKNFIYEICNNYKYGLFYKMTIHRDMKILQGKSLL